jgi:hypothetical protein
MKFKRVHTNQDEYYSIGIDEETGGYVLDIVMTGVAWYSRYFRLTKEEFEAYPKNRATMDRLARGCAGASGIENNRARFISSQKTDENR